MMTSILTTTTITITIITATINPPLWVAKRPRSACRYT